MKSTEPTVKPLSELTKEYQPPKIQDQPHVKTMATANLPAPILAAIRSALSAAHWISIIPNTSAAIVTSEVISNLPPGYTVTLVFDEDPANLPRDHTPGDVYILK